MSSAIRLALLVFLVAGVAVLARWTVVGEWVQAAAATLTALADRTWAAPAYFGLYAVALGLGFPGSALTLLGGAAFGMWPGLLVNFLGALAGASLAFYEARLLGRDVVVRLAGRRLARLEGLASPRAAFLTFARLRLIPLVPFNGVNFAAGLTTAPFPAYLGGTAIGIVPSTLLWTYFADAIVHGTVDVREAAGARLALALIGLSIVNLVPVAVDALRRRGSR